jgi:hypothetical protein
VKPITIKGLASSSVELREDITADVHLRITNLFGSAMVAIPITPSMARRLAKALLKFADQGTTKTDTTGKKGRK